MPSELEGVPGSCFRGHLVLQTGSLGVISAIGMANMAQLFRVTLKIPCYFVGFPRAMQLPARWVSVFYQGQVGQAVPLWDGLFQGNKCCHVHLGLSFWGVVPLFWWYGKETKTTTQLCQVPFNFEKHEPPIWSAAKVNTPLAGTRCSVLHASFLGFGRDVRKQATCTQQQ